jgi:exopolyphosphatase/guanosine-5'-triphosphate,3'-diphosphate pyrophosphatase
VTTTPVPGLPDLSGARTLATIDIGTNTTLLLVARVLGGRDIEVLAERAEITRLGRGIGRGGELGAVGIDATLGALREYARVAHAHGAHIAAIGTEGLRRAPNARVFLDAAREILGVEVEVIDGPREAALTFRAVVESFPGLAGGGTPLVVVDIGGGSTEIIVAEPMRGDAGGGVSAGVDVDIRLRTSLPLGSVRLTERHMRSEPPHADEIAAARDEIAATLATITLGLGTPAQTPASVPTAPTLVGVAGTVTSLAAMAQNLTSYDPSKVHGFRLDQHALDAQIARLMHSTQTQREAMAGLDPRRADVILAGALILRALVTRTGAAAVLVSDRGIRWGLLYDLIRRS